MMKDIYRLFGIYRITNLLNGKSYIGKTGMNFGDRWDSHRSLLNSGKHDNRHLQNAWNKYGADNFEFQIVETVDDTSFLNDLERSYISKYKNLGLAYNISDGGDGGMFLGKHLSEETKRKIGEKNRMHMTGRKLSDETRRKMSEAQLRRNWTPEQLERQREISRAANLGRVRSEETRALLRKINQENPPSAKLTPDDVREMRRRRSIGDKIVDIAADYNMSPSYVSNVIHGRRWGHIN